MIGVGAMRRQLCGSLVRSGPVTRVGFCRGMSSACGSQILSKGKHAGLSYSECLANDPQYCSFVLGRAHQMGPSYHGFVDYLRSQADHQSESWAADTPVSDAQVEADGGYRYGGAPVSETPRNADDGYRYGGAASDDGETMVGFGKHRGLTFRQLLEQEPNYCQWIVREAAARDERGEPPKEAFTALLSYIQGSAARGAPAAVTRPAHGQRYARGSYGGRSASPASHSPPEGSDFVSGTGDVADVPLASATVAFGTKYKDRTFGEVVRADRDYSSYILNQVLNSPEPRGANMVAFALYVQYVMCRDAVRV